MSCGDFDGNTLRKEAQKKDLPVANYLKRWINLKKAWPCHVVPDPAKTTKQPPVYDFTKSDTISTRCGPVIGGMERMLAACELELEGRHHCGLDDTKNLARCVIFLLEKGYNFTQGMVNSYPF
jgi:3'-5' exoribonuclease 1/ERI1 exoribonuclease 3